MSRQHGHSSGSGTIGPRVLDTPPPISVLPSKPVSLFGQRVNGLSAVSGGIPSEATVSVGGCPNCRVLAGKIGHLGRILDALEVGDPKASVQLLVELRRHLSADFDGGLVDAARDLLGLKGVKDETVWM